MISEFSEVLFKAYKNPTKLAIIALLLKNAQMTVTQLSKVIKTTRPNLYRSIRELVEDGIIKKPRVEVAKNYVEKYYELNLEIFKEVKAEHMKEKISRASTQDFRELTTSFLLMNSLLSNVFAEQVKMASDSEIERYRQAMLDGYILASYSILSRGSMKEFSKHYDQFVKHTEKQENADKKEDYALIVLSFPLR